MVPPPVAKKPSLLVVKFSIKLAFTSFSQPSTGFRWVAKKFGGISEQICIKVFKGLLLFSCRQSWKNQRHTHLWWVYLPLKHNKSPGYLRTDLVCLYVTNVAVGFKSPMSFNHICSCRHISLADNNRMDRTIQGFPFQPVTFTACEELSCCSQICAFGIQMVLHAKIVFMCKRPFTSCLIWKGNPCQLLASTIETHWNTVQK